MSGNHIRKLNNKFMIIKKLRQDSWE